MLRARGFLLYATRRRLHLHLFYKEDACVGRVGSARLRGSIASVVGRAAPWSVGRGPSGLRKAGNGPTAEGLEHPEAPNPISGSSRGNASGGDRATHPTKNPRLRITQMRKRTSVRKALRDLGLENALETSPDARLRGSTWLTERPMKQRERELLTTGRSPDGAAEEARYGRPYQCSCGRFHSSQSEAVRCSDCLQGLGEYSASFEYRERVVVFHDWRDRSLGRCGRASVVWKAGMRPVDLGRLGHMLLVPLQADEAERSVVREFWTPASVRVRGTGHNPRK